MKFLAGAIFLSLTFLSCVGLLGCATGSSMALPSANTLSGSGSSARTTPDNNLRRGRALLVTECTSCHRFFEPGEFEAEEWESILPAMIGRTAISKRQGTDLAAYVMSAARYAQEQEATDLVTQR